MPIRQLAHIKLTKHRHTFGEVAYYNKFLSRILILDKGNTKDFLYKSNTLLVAETWLGTIFSSQNFQLFIDHYLVKPPLTTP